MKKLALAILLGLWFARPAGATQTENNALHIVPAKGEVKIDGEADDWDLSGGIFACDDVERLRDVFSVWFFAMYDQQNLYLLAKFKDSDPLNNNQSSKGGHGFAGDCLQVRFISGYKTPDERVSHWTCWRDRDGVSVMEGVYNRDFKGDKLENALNNGARQAFKIDSDGKGYTQEIAIPWKLITASGKAPEPGDNLRMAIEPNFTAGPWGRINIHDIFRAGVVPDRVFTFRAYDQWGEGVIEKSGNLQIAPVRLSDEREFPVDLTDGFPVANWTGLVQKKELPGFKTISFNLPEGGYVSLNIKNSQGEVVRQLLTENYYEAGAHEVKWDGLTTSTYKTPGTVVEPGQYTWEAIVHPAFSLTLRGWAFNSGATPWENGPKTHWGADHGVPDAVATDGEKVYLGWNASEAGKSLLGCDLDGHVVWKIGSGLGFGVDHLAVDQSIVFAVGHGEIVRLRSSDGVFDNWEGQMTAGLEVGDLWKDKPDAALWPATAEGLDVRDGAMYLAFSNPAVLPGDITDWKAFIARLLDGSPLSNRVLALIDARLTQSLKAFLAGKKDQKQAFSTGGRATFDLAVAKALTSLLGAPDLVEGGAKLGPGALAAANRQALVAHFSPALGARHTDFIALCDAHSGKVLKTFDVTSPRGVHVLGDHEVGFVADGSAIESLDTQTGRTKTLIRGLQDATNFTVGPDGKFYVAIAGASPGVRIFSADGKPAGTIGRKGGRRLVGPWQPDGLNEPQALVVDKLNRLWVAEADKTPKRISVWDLATGQLVKDFFGAAHYGASGGAIDPLDPNVMVGEGCEWILDPATGQARCTGIFDRDPLEFAVFCPGSNKRLYLAVINEVMHNLGGLRVYERVGEGDYKLRAEWRPDYATQTTAVWSDENGDGKQQPDEVTTLPYTVRLHGSNQWSGNINPADLTLYGGVIGENAARQLASVALEQPPKDVKFTQTVFDKVFRFDPAGFTKCGAPKWDLKNVVDLSYLWSQKFSNAGFGMLPSPDNKLLVTCGSDAFRCWDLTARKQIWSYPNPFYQVHGSHLAPPPLPGLTRGAYGLIGTFGTPEAGRVWLINGNCGEWYMLTQGGYFLGHLFQGDPLKMHYPEVAKPGADLTEAPSGSGGEDFGGSVTQAPDGKVYIEAGKTGYWNVLASGFDQIKSAGSGQVSIASSDLAQAAKLRDQQMQAASGTHTITVKRGAVTFTGNVRKDFAGQQPAAFQKSEDSPAEVAAAWDDHNLYLGWTVADTTPWANSANEAPQMYLNGDTVDFQFGSDLAADAKRREAVAGDFRVSIGSFQGQPTAVLYRKVSTVKKPRIFSSGVINRYEMDYVDTLPEAHIVVTPRPDKKGYTVEASIPWKALGFTPQAGATYRGDFGVTYGNESGTRTRLRSYWNNQETGLVDDAVFEVMMAPANWGNIVFQK